MSSGNRFIDKAARRAEALPLARIAGLMLGGATAFFCYAMPQRVLDASLGGVGVPVPAGPVVRGVFILGCGLLAAAIGWLVLMAAGRRSPVDADESEGDIVFETPLPRRRGIGAEAAAPAKKSSGNRRGDGPSVRPRRPIFAEHDLGTPIDEIEIEIEIDQAETPAEPKYVTVAALPPFMALPNQPADGVPAALLPAPDEVPPAEADVVTQEGPGAAAVVFAADEPLELGDPLASQLLPAAAPAPALPVSSAPIPPAEAAELSLAALMARFEQGLDRLAGDLPPPPSRNSVATLRQPDRGDDDALHSALEALQRMAARQR